MSRLVLKLLTVDPDRAEFRGFVEAHIPGVELGPASYSNGVPGPPRAARFAVLTSLSREEWDKAGGPLVVEVELPDNVGD